MARVLIDGIDYATRRTIRERGWTDGMIDKLLGQCDMEWHNLHSDSLPGRSRLFVLDRVAALESTDAFRAAQRTSRTRRAAAVIDLLEQCGPRDLKQVKEWLERRGESSQRETVVGQPIPPPSIVPA